MPTILLIEDALDLAQVVQRELEAAGYRVRHASDGLTGLELLTQQPPDLVILDWMLPRMDGLEVLRRMRQSSAVPVLMLTARKEEVDRVVGLEVGADDYVTKPFSMRELIARVRALLRRIEHVQEVLAADKSAADTPITYGSLRLDPSAYWRRWQTTHSISPAPSSTCCTCCCATQDARSVARTFWTPSGAKTMSLATARWITPSCACARNSERSAKR
jgi:DNA-binding response OmpR family regulator